MVGRTHFAAIFTILISNRHINQKNIAACELAKGKSAFSNNLGGNEQHLSRSNPDKLASAGAADLHRKALNLPRPAAHTSAEIPFQIYIMVSGSVGCCSSCTDELWETFQRCRLCV